MKVSDEYCQVLGLDVHDFAIEPRGDLDFIDSITHTFIHPDLQAIVKSANGYINSFYPSCPNGSLLVHCTHGQDTNWIHDRTDTVLFSYNWTKNQDI